MASSKERQKKGSDLHRAIIEGDVGKVCSLAMLRPTINPGLILAVMQVYKDIRAHPEGKNVTPLLVAIHLGSVEMCRYLIAEGADVNWGYIDGMGPLTIALNEKHYNIAELLIKSGANVHAPDRLGRVPIHHAIDVDSPVSIVKTILSEGFPKDSVILENYLIKSRPLTRAISVKNVEVVKFLLDQGVDVNSRTTEGTTPLLIAISHRSPEIVKLLIDHGANVEGLSKNEAPPLFLAVHADDPSMLKILLDAGVDVNRLFTPLDYVHNVLFLPYTTALQLAAMGCNFPATKLLIEYGADVNAINPLNNGTSLHMVFSVEPRNLDDSQKIMHRKIIQFLLDNGSDTKVKDIEGKQPIHYAFSSKNWIALEECIRSGANPNEVVSQRHGSILRFAISNKYVGLATTCLDFGADIFQKFKGRPIYNDVIKNDTPEILRLFWKFNYPFDETHSEELFKNKLNVSNLQFIQKCFMESVMKNDLEAVERALKLGVEVNCRFKDGDHPLYICSARGDLELVKILIKNGAKISTISNSGYTALHVAARAGHIEICKLLLQHGACLNYRGPCGSTPCQLAQLAGFADVVILLKSASKFFYLLKNEGAKIVDIMKEKLGSTEFDVYMNCVNRRGNTLLGEALRLHLTDIVENLMALRLRMV